MLCAEDHGVLCEESLSDARSPYNASLGAVDVVVDDGCHSVAKLEKQDI